MVLETANERRVISVPPTVRSNTQAGSNLWPLLARLATRAANIDDLMEGFIAWTHQTAGTAEVVCSSERFYLDFGKVFHDDSFYSARTSYFFDYLIFERRLSNQAAPTSEGATPYQFLLGQLQAQQDALPRLIHEQVLGLGEFRHSLFQILKINEKSMLLQDLLAPAKITVQAKPMETFRGLEKKTILQAFVFPLGSINQLSSGIVLHPQKANRLIKKCIKKARSTDDFSAKSLLSRLATVQIRYLRHRHVSPKLIYQAIKD